MVFHLIVAPAGCGKTESMLHLARASAAGLRAQPLIVVPSALQRRSARRRLAALGGALGVHILQFDQLYAHILRAGNQQIDELPDPVQFRLLREITTRLAAQERLEHYAELAAMPGFVRAVRERIELLKAAGIFPERLAKLWRDAPARLRDIAAIYAVWQAELRAHNWADRAGFAWVAVEALETHGPLLTRPFAPIIFDGFDDFTEVQVRLIAALARSNGPAAPDLYVTLTGDPADTGELPARAAHRRFHATRRLLQQRTGVRAQPLAADCPAGVYAPALLHLQQTIFDPSFSSLQMEKNGGEADAAIDFVEASTRTLEVRAALRWIKEQILRAPLEYADCAVLARNLLPYRAALLQVSAEFGIPLQIEDGLPLNQNPAVAALLLLLRTATPDENGRTPLARRPVVELWRSPYFDWRSMGLLPGDADRLDTLARAGRVIAGSSHWEQAFAAQLAATARQENSAANEEAPQTLPRAEIERLRDCFARFVGITAPPAAGQVRDHVLWLERLMGGRDDLDAPEAPTEETVVDNANSAETTDQSLHMLRRLQQHPEGIEGIDSLAALVQRDRAALWQIKEILRGLVRAEEALEQSAPHPFHQFLADLLAAIEAATYRVRGATNGSVVAATTLQARGIPFHSVAILGLAEGELPATLREDPFLRDSDRLALQQAGLAVALSTESAEREYFLDALARARRRLLLVRPRLAEAGAAWEPSPYWEEVRGRVTGPLELATLGSAIQPQRAASPAELVEGLSLHRDEAAFAWTEALPSAPLQQRDRAAHILRERARRTPTPFDGDLSSRSTQLEQHVGPARLWSPTSLETYLACGFRFYVSKVLRLEPRPEPAEGTDIAQLGTLYHELFEAAYKHAQHPGDLESVLAAFEAHAGPILESAPERLGFRATSLWARQRTEIEAQVRAGLVALAEYDGVPIAHELRFGSKHPMALERDGKTLRLTGVIDRLDRLPNGSLRVIDYKTGKATYDTPRSLQKGQRFQIALYALAARNGLDLGPVSDGFYFFAHKAEAAGWSLATYPGGVQAALDTAKEHAWAAAQGARSGLFKPTPPDGGCPEYCPAAAFCWRYTPQNHG